MVQPEKVLINMEVNYFQDDSDFSPLHNYSKEMQGSCGLLYPESISAATQEGNGVVINESQWNENFRLNILDTVFSISKISSLFEHWKLSGTVPHYNKIKAMYQF